MGGLITAHDWAKSPVGVIESWPRNLRLALELILQSPVPMLISWGHTQLAFYNDAFMQIAGPHHPALLGSTIAEHWPELAHILKESSETVFSGKALYLRDQILHDRQTRPHFDFGCSPILGNDGNPAGILAVVTGTPAQNAVEYRALFHSIDIGFCVIQMKFDDSETAIDYRFLEVNNAFEDQTGLAGAEGKWMRALAPNHEQHWFDIYGTVALTGNQIRFEMPAAALDGRWYEVSAFRIGQPEKRQVAVLFKDIKERKNAENALQKAYRELERTSAELVRSNEDLEQFARVAGHDLRAPLLSIIKFSQLLQRRQKNPDADTQEILHYIVDSGKRLAQLIDDLLRYASLPQTSAQLTSAAPAALACTQAQDNLRVAVQESGATIENHIQADVSLASELSILTQLFQNLLSNAIHYRRPDTKPHIVVTAFAQNEFWKFGVQDNGEGIDAQYLTQIFEPFRRLHGPERPGSGIGLATCKRIVERSGGTIWAESCPNEGSTFHFLLPKYVSTA